MILASQSPRRRELLAALGLQFDVLPADLEEESIAAGLEPRAGAIAVARAKAAALAETYPDAVVLAADTVVILDGQALGKPRDSAHALVMLEALRDRAHEVVTAVCLRVGQTELVEAPSTSVLMRAYTPAEVDAYIATGSPLDKAGAYGIQDEPFSPVARIEGCYCNVMGLPLWTVSALLSRAGHDPREQPDGTIARCRECPLR